MLLSLLLTLLGSGPAVAQGPLPRLPARAYLYVTTDTHLLTSEPLGATTPQQLLAALEQAEPRPPGYDYRKARQVERAFHRHRRYYRRINRRSTRAMRRESQKRQHQQFRSYRREQRELPPNPPPKDRKSYL